MPAHAVKDHPQLQELVKFLAEALVDAPDEVVVEEIEEEGAPVFELHRRRGRSRQGHRQAGPHRPRVAHHPERGGFQGAHARAA